MIDRKTALEKLQGHVKPDTTNWKEKAQERKDNRHWSRRSQKIAIRILITLKERGMQQKQLAEMMGVAPQQVNKWVKGKENFTLDTVGRIEKALGIDLLQIPVIVREEVDRKELDTTSKKVKSLGGPKIIKLTNSNNSNLEKIG